MSDAEQPELPGGASFEERRLPPSIYDDEAFTAGWQMGVLDTHLRRRDLPRLGWLPIPAACSEQVDLIAMEHGYTTRFQPVEDAPGWSIVLFERTGAEPDGGAR